MQEAIIKNFVLKHFRYFVLFLSSNQRYDRCFRVTKIPLRNISSLNNSLSIMAYIGARRRKHLFSLTNFRIGYLLCDNVLL